MPLVSAVDGPLVAVYQDVALNYHLLEMSV